jgi:hypothetical protein
MSSSSVDLSVAELIQALRYDCVSFFSFFLGEELTQEVPELHETIWAELLTMVQEVNQKETEVRLQKLFAVPRDFAKTTVAKLAVILFLKYTRLRFALYTSKTNGHAKNAIRDILEWLLSPQHEMLFGHSTVVKSSETESLWIIDMAIRNAAGESVRLKRCIFKALGTDQQVRGLNVNNVRPQIIILDDIEDTDNTTKELQPKLDAWVMGSLRKAFDASGSVCIFIGNMIRETTLLARLSKDPAWNPTVFGCLVRDKTTGELRSLWEARHPLERLLAEYKEYRALGLGHLWEAEMMNLTQDEILVASFEHAVQPPQPSPEAVESGCLCLDPAFGEKHYNDDSAITVHAKLKDVGIPCVIDSWVGKLGEEALFDKLLEFSYKWGISTWCIESEAAQKLLIPYFRLLIRDRKMNEALFVMLPIMSGKASKASRILAFRSAFGSGSYGICDSEFDLVERLSSYDPTSTNPDDLCDSAAYGVVCWQFHGATITQQGIKQIAMLAFNREDMSAIFTESQVSAF